MNNQPQQEKKSSFFFAYGSPQFVIGATLVNALLNTDSKTQKSVFQGLAALVLTFIFLVLIVLGVNELMGTSNNKNNLDVVSKELHFTQTFTEDDIQRIGLSNEFKNLNIDCNINHNPPTKAVLNVWINYVLTLRANHNKKVSNIHITQTIDKKYIDMYVHYVGDNPSQWKDEIHRFNLITDEYMGKVKFQLGKN
jgi:hypothetical protein